MAQRIEAAEQERLARAEAAEAEARSSPRGTPRKAAPSEAAVDVSDAEAAARPSQPFLSSASARLGLALGVGLNGPLGTPDSPRVATNSGGVVWGVEI